MNIRKEEVKNFENSKIGIISSARIFGEGVNIKICDAVCFADNKSSAVDITQYVGRCLRKCEDIKPNKESYVLLPFFYDCKNNGNFFNINDKNSPYYRILKVLKTLGDSDDRIQHKFRLLDCYPDIIQVEMVEIYFLLFQIKMVNKLISMNLKNKLFLEFLIEKVIQLIDGEKWFVLKIKKDTIKVLI